MSKCLQRALLAALLTLGAGCATVDFDAEKPVSRALTDTSDTYLGELLSRYADKPKNESGFFLIQIITFRDREPRQQCVRVLDLKFDAVCVLRIQKLWL